MMALGRDSGWVSDNCLVMGAGTKAGVGEEGCTDGWTDGVTTCGGFVLWCVAMGKRVINVMDDEEKEVRI